MLPEQKILRDQRFGSCRPEGDYAQDPEKMPKATKSVVHGGYDAVFPKPTALRSFEFATHRLA